MTPAPPLLKLRRLLSLLCARAKGDFREEDHPRADAGQFSSSPGSGGAGEGGGKGRGKLTLDADKLPATVAEAQQAAPAVAKSILKTLRGMPARLWQVGAGKVKQLYAKMEAKYGKGWARAIVAVGVVTFPTPFTTGAVLATMGLARVCVKLFGKSTAAVQAALAVLWLKAQGEGADMEKIFARAQAFVRKLAEALEGEDLDGEERRQLEKVVEGLNREDEE